MRWKIRLFVLCVVIVLHAGFETNEFRYSFGMCVFIDVQSGVEAGSPFLAEPVSPMHVTTPVVEVPPVVVEYVQPDSVVDASAPAPTVTYTAQSPLPAVPAPPLRDTAPAVVEFVNPAVAGTYVAPAPVVDCIAPAPAVS